MASIVPFSIELECRYRGGSTATGFQVIVHQRNEVEKLYVTQTHSETQASVVVRENIMYQVVVFPIREESGIVGSSVEYLEQLIILNTIPFTTITHSTIKGILQQKLQNNNKTTFQDHYLGYMNARIKVLVMIL